MSRSRARRGAPRHVVFVYGSLRRGLSNHARLAGARDLGDDETATASYTMRAYSQWFPGVCDGGSTTIRGEVYEVDDDGLAALDRLESNGRFYTRREVPLASGRVAWIYLLPPEEMRGDRVASGDWLRYASAPGPEPSAVCAVCAAEEATWDDDGLLLCDGCCVAVGL